MSNKLLERNRLVNKRCLTDSKEMKQFRESFKRAHGIDPLDAEKLPVMKEGFSWSKLKDKLSSTMREADAASAYTQFLRAGVQSITNAMYESTASTYEEWVTVIQSQKDTELYAPLHGVSFPRQVGPSEHYPELGSAALDIKLQNRKFGSIYSIQRELLDDDQTGQFQKQAGLMGEYMKLVTEVWVYGKLASVSGGCTYQDLKIPVSETKPSSESVYPWSTALVGGGATRPSAFGAFNQANVQAGYIGLHGQKNLLGILMSVAPNRIVVTPRNQFDASVLLNSAYYPTGATAGATGGAFSINPIKGIADLTVARYLFDNLGVVNPNGKSWYLMDDSKPWFVNQVRESVTVEQENPMSGNSFELDEFRFKARMRMNADFIDPRFAWQGNDGSV